MEHQPLVCYEEPSTYQRPLPLGMAVRKPYGHCDYLALVPIWKVHGFYFPMFQSMRDFAPFIEDGCPSARRVSADSEGTLRRATEGGLGVDCMKGRHREGLLLSISAAARDGRTITLPGPPDDPESFRKAYGCLLYTSDAA